MKPNQSNVINNNPENNNRNKNEVLNKLNKSEIFNQLPGKQDNKMIDNSINNISLIHNSEFVNNTSEQMNFRPTENLAFQRSYNNSKESTTATGTESLHSHTSDSNQ